MFGLVLGEFVCFVLVVVGGVKVFFKIDFLENFVLKVDMLVIGGGMVNIFFVVKGIDVSKLLCEYDFVEIVNCIMVVVDVVNCEIVLLVDVVVVREFKVGVDNEIVVLDVILVDGMIFDVGMVLIVIVIVKIDIVKILVWNGLFGVFEIVLFDWVIVVVVKYVVENIKVGKLNLVVGGGDIVVVLNYVGVVDDFFYVFIVGGVFLEWLEGKDFLGVKVLG